MKIQINTQCPVSFEYVDHNSVRVTGLLTIAMIAAFAATGFSLLAVALCADYAVRAWTSKTSPMQQLGGRIARALNIPELMKDKAPKRFAAQIGFLFAATAAALAFFSPSVAVGVALSLLFFNVLDSVFDFCVGCFCYTVLVVPMQQHLTA
jgi:hypothetical protein